MFLHHCAQQIDCLHDFGRCQGVIGPLPVPTRGNESLVAQDRKVLGYVGLGDFKGVDEVGHRHFAIAKGIDDQQPLWVCQSLTDMCVEANHLALDGTHVPILRSPGRERKFAALAKMRVG